MTEHIEKEGSKHHLLQVEKSLRPWSTAAVILESPHRFLFGSLLESESSILPAVLVHYQVILLFHAVQQIFNPCLHTCF